MLGSSALISYCVQDGSLSLESVVTIEDGGLTPCSQGSVHVLFYKAFILWVWDQLPSITSTPVLLVSQLDKGLWGADRSQTVLLPKENAFSETLCVCVGGGCMCLLLDSTKRCLGYISGLLVPVKAQITEIDFFSLSTPYL